ncbi:MAG TPA: thiamine biosynthesis protein [Nitrosopumilaceae archaeon]|nr:thiamine biosynthesis protein [Nitrosopumilaceae archaeon]
MGEKTVIIVFPTIFSLNKIDYLISNITKILKMKNQSYNKIQQNDSVIIIDAKDPVIASSIIGTLFGIERIAIATEVENRFDNILSNIAKIGSNLLLRGEKFLIKVEGQTTEYMPKDLELAATSSLIEKTSHLQTKPGSETTYDKLLYTYLTKSHAYICIFIDKGNGGIPYNSHNEKILCCVHDEFSAITCLQIIKMGFEPKILVCYQSEPDLLNTIKMINQILSHIVQDKVELEFCKLSLKSSGSSGILFKTVAITEMLTAIATRAKIERVSVAISSLMFPSWFIEYNAKAILKKNLMPWFPLLGIDDSIFENATELGLEKYMSKIQNLCKLKFKGSNFQKDRIRKVSQIAINSRKTIVVKTGTKNVHDIIDSLKSNH